MTGLAKFDECFEQAFAEGLSDIKFFVRKSNNVTAEALMAEALEFQRVIKSGRVTRITSVD